MAVGKLVGEVEIEYKNGRWNLYLDLPRWLANELEDKVLAVTGSSYASDKPDRGRVNFGSMTKAQAIDLYTLWGEQDDH